MVNCVPALVGDLIIRYDHDMRTITATEASRKFSELLDAIEAGETVTITRGNRPIAEVRPARRRSVGEFREALAALSPLDDEFASDVAEGLSIIRDEWRDPWDGE